MQEQAPVMVVMVPLPAGDRIVAAVLGALHAEPARPWTLKELATVAHSSRSVVAERFQRRLGCGPIQYLTRWRLSLAATRLTAGDESMARIAAAIGYETDTAFSRAFRRQYGVPPATWRRLHAGEPATVLARQDDRAVFPV